MKKPVAISVSKRMQEFSAFSKAGMACILRRTPRWMEEQGCGYALKLWTNQIDAAVDLLRENKIQLRKRRVNMKKICKLCGKEFESTKAGSKFCCNAHKTRYRKSLGLDNETRKCVVCGKKFSANKYQPTKTCSKECSLNWRLLY